MAIIQQNLRTTAQFEYKTDYDETGNLDLPSYSKTVGYVRETATDEQIYNGVKALFSITVYEPAPYHTYRTDKAQLIVD